MSKLPKLKIDDLIVDVPIIQGGMGVGISLSSLAGTVSACGGIGLISSAQIGYREKEFEKNPLLANEKAIVKELKKARLISKNYKKKYNKNTNGAIGFNIMVATKGYENYVKTAVAHGADIIVSGAGLPLDLPRYRDAGTELRKDIADEDFFGNKERVTKIVPIVSSAKSATVTLKMWDRKYKTTADAVVVEGPLAGGHLGFTLEELKTYGADKVGEYKREVFDEEIKAIIKVISEYENKYNKEIPLIVAGGIFTYEDVRHNFLLGANGVQAGTRFVATYECDAPDYYKSAYIRATKEDVKITKSPVGLPGRAVDNDFLKKVKLERPKIDKCYQCLNKCDINAIPYCITDALIKAANGDSDNALMFAGENVWRIKKIDSVENVIKELCGEN